MSDSTLLPCPFCGSESVAVHTIDGWFVECQNTKEPACDIRIGHCDWTHDAVFEMWNRRTGLTSEQEAAATRLIAKVGIFIVAMGSKPIAEYSHAVAEGRLSETGHFKELNELYIKLGKLFPTK